MRTTTLILLLAVALPSTAVSGPIAYATTGAYALGEPVGALLADACQWPELEGVNSNCVSLPSSAGGLRYTLRAEDSSSTLLGTTVCFYDASNQYVVCDPSSGRVPHWAATMSVSSLGGTEVVWRFYAYH